MAYPPVIPKGPPGRSGAVPVKAPALETLEILDNTLRQPLDQERKSKAEPVAVKTKVHWLTVECLDKPGNLADIARAIAQHEQNIKVGLCNISLPSPV